MLPVMTAPPAVESTPGHHRVRILVAPLLLAGGDVDRGEMAVGLALGGVDADRLAAQERHALDEHDEPLLELHAALDHRQEGEPEVGIERAVVRAVLAAGEPGTDARRFLSLVHGSHPGVESSAGPWRRFRSPS